MRRPAIRQASPFVLTRRWSLESLVFPPPSPTPSVTPYLSRCLGTGRSPTHPATIWRRGGNIPLTRVTRRQCRSNPECRDCLRRTSATIVGVCAFGRRQRARLANSSRPPPRSIARLNLRREQTNTPWNDAASQHLHDPSDHGDTSRPGRTRLRGFHILPRATQIATRPGSESHRGFGPLARNFSRELALTRARITSSSPGP